VAFYLFFDNFDLWFEKGKKIRKIEKMKVTYDNFDFEDKR